MSITIRLAGIEDIDFIADGYEEIAHLESKATLIDVNKDFKKNVRTTLTELLSHPEYLLLIAQKETQPIAALVGSIQPLPFEKTGSLTGIIHTVYTGARQSKNGAATLLVAAFERTLREHGAKYIDVQCVIGNKPAESLWLKLDYKPIATTSRKTL